MDPNYKKLYDRQTHSVQQEAEKAGVQVTSLDFLGDDGDMKDKIKATLAAAIGGRLKSNIVQIFKLTGASGPYTYVQPYQSFVTMPGEYHAIVQAGLEASAILRKGFLFKNWESKDQDLAGRLNANPALKKALRKLKWSWPIGRGIIKFKWALQVRPLPNGKVHVVMKAGRYGGLTAYKVGVGVFENVLMELKQALTGSHGPESPFVAAPAFDQLFLSRQ